MIIIEEAIERLIEEGAIEALTLALGSDDNPETKKLILVNLVNLSHDGTLYFSFTFVAHL